MIAVHPEADAESVEAVDYYRARKPDLGLRFVNQLATVFSEIERHPERWPADEKGSRHIKLKGFPYLVFYRVRGDFVRVLAVSHGARKPGYWEDRISDPM